MTGRTHWHAVAEAYLRATLGDPTSRDRHGLRWGRKGSLHLLSSGSITDFADGETRPLLDYVAVTEGLINRQAAAEHLRGMGLLPDFYTRRAQQAPTRPKRRPAPQPKAQGQPSGTDREPARNEPFHDHGLLQLDYSDDMPADPADPVNLWAASKCRRRPRQPWPSGLKVLRGWRDGGTAWGGLSLLAPVSSPDGWLHAPDGIPRRTVRGVHVVHIDSDGQPRTHRGLNKRTWADGLRLGPAPAVRLGWRPGAFATGLCRRQGPDGRVSAIPEQLHVVEGLADGLAVHWHYGWPTVCSLGTQAGLAPAAPDLARLAREGLQLHLWPDADPPNPETGRRAGAKGTARLLAALRAADCIQSLSDITWEAA